MTQETAPIALDRYETLEEMQLAGVRDTHALADMQTAMPVQWARFEALGPLPEQVDGPERRCAYGVYCATDMQAGTVEYMCAAEVAAFERPVEEVQRLISPAGRYAVFNHDGPPETLGATWQLIMGQWMRHSDEARHDAPPFERFDARGPIEIWMPVQAP